MSDVVVKNHIYDFMRSNNVVEAQQAIGVSSSILLSSVEVQVDELETDYNINKPIWINTSTIVQSNSATWSSNEIVDFDSNVISAISANPSATREAMGVSVLGDELFRSITPTDARELLDIEEDNFEVVDINDISLDPALTPITDITLDSGVWKVNANYSLQTTLTAGTANVRSRMQIISGSGSIYGKRVICPHQGNMVSYTLFNISTVNHDMAITVGSPNFKLGESFFDTYVTVTSPLIIRFSFGHTIQPLSATIGKMFLTYKKQKI